MSEANKYRLISISILVLFFPLVVFGSTLYFIPSSQTVQLGETFLVDVKVMTDEEKPINAVDLGVNFNSEFLEIRDIFIGGSILELWVERPGVKDFLSQNNAEQYAELGRKQNINIVGGIPKGFLGEGLLAKILFEAKKPVDVTLLSFSEDSQVLLNDGKGTKDAINPLEGVYDIAAGQAERIEISSGNCPNQDKWCNINIFDIYWDKNSETLYSYILSYDSASSPDDTSDEPTGSIRFENLDDGIYYFSLYEGHETDTKPIHETDTKLITEITRKGRYRVMIDGTMPEPFEIQVVNIEGKNYLAFSATDETSGINYYEVVETTKNNRQFRESDAKSPYLLKNQSLGEKIEVTAVDKAGNRRVTEMVLPYKFNFKEVFYLLLIAGILGIIVWIISKIKNQISETQIKN